MSQILQSPTMPSTMRAVRYHRFGGPEVLQIETVPVPAVADDHLLIRVRSAGLSGGEPAIHAGKIAMVMGKNFPQGVGVEFAGEVVARGPLVKDHAVGQAVWGVTPHKTFGALADYVSVPQERRSALPSTLSALDAGAMPAVGTTVVRALSREIGLRGGERILIRGASGGVGIAALQYAKFLGAEVVTLSSKHNVDWLLQQGADAAFDHRALDLKRLGKFDAILDAVGTQVGRYRRLLNSHGRMVELAVDPDRLLQSMLYIGATSIFGERRVRMFSNNAFKTDLEELAGLVASGAIAPVIERVWPIEDVGDAYRRLSKGGVRGRHIIGFP